MKYGTVKGPEALVALTIGACIAPGIGKITSKAAAYIAGTVTGGILAKYINGTEVKIVLNRYIVRAGDGTKKFKVYATFYDKNGNFIDAKLAQAGDY